jgi:catechol 2,3-dioxygenase-like lactoylglutathione lyase family enzyme
VYWIDHVGIVVSDLQVASRFYTDLFQTAVIESNQWRGADADRLAASLGERAGLELDACFVALPHMNAFVELLQVSGLAQKRLRLAPTDVGAVHLGLYVDSAEQALERLGRPTTGSVTGIPYGPCKGGKTAYLTDPDGVNIQFMQLDQRPGKLPLLKGANGWIDHIGIVVADLDRSLGFYSKLLETKPVQREAWRGKDADYVAAMLGRPSGIELEAGFIQIPHTNTLLELIQYSGFEQKRVDAAASDIGAVHLGFYVDSVQGTLTRMGKATPGRITEMSGGTASDGEAAYLPDPDGLTIQVLRLARRPGNLPILRPSIVT